MALPDSPTKTPSGVTPQIDQLSDDQLINRFKQNPVGFARELIKDSSQLYRFWRLAETRSFQDQALVNAYDKAQKILATAAPLPQAQPKPQSQPAPPAFDVFHAVGEEQKQTKNTINEKNAPAIETWLNSFKSRFYDFVAKRPPLTPQAKIFKENVETALKQAQYYGATGINVSTGQMINFLAMFQGEILNYYLSEGSMEMLFSALGPVGNLWRAGYEKQFKWKMDWLKNPLNPNSIDFYMRSLPEREAFKIALMPARLAMGIFARGGGPFTKATYYDYFEKNPENRVKEKYFFTPYLKLTQAAHLGADALDGINHLSYDKDRWQSWTEQTNNHLQTAINQYRKAKEGGGADLSTARRQLNHALNQYNGSIFRHLLANTSRRLRSTERDPISYLLSLIGGTLWDLTAGMVLNVVRMTLGKIINVIPGVNLLRAQFAEFLTSNRFLNTARIGGASINSFVRGVVSPTTISSGYLGYQIANYLFPNSPMAVAWTTGVAGGLGAFYNIAAKMAVSDIPLWTEQYQIYRLAQTAGVSELDMLEGTAGIKADYLRGLKPGIFSNFATWLYKNPLVKLPINGFAIGDLFSEYMRTNYGWNPWVTRFTFAGADYFWQTKGTWGNLLNQTVFRPFIKIWTQPSWTIFGKTFFTPYWRTLSLQNPSSIAFRFRGFYQNLFYEQSFGTDALVQRRWFSGFNRYVKPFSNNFFNPGFFMGFGMVPWLSTFMPAPWAYVVAPVAGSLTWNLAAYTLEKTFGMRIASMGKLNAWGWAGYIIGTILEFVIPGAQPWLPIATSIAFPIAGMILSALNVSLIEVLAAAIAPIYTAITGLTLSTAAFAGWLAGWATAMTIGTVVTLGVFFAYTVYAGFWVPMMEEAKAGTESTNFSIDSSTEELGPNKYKFCSDFSVTQDVFNSTRYLWYKTDFQATGLTVDLTDPPQVTDAFRGQELNFVDFSPDTIESTQYSIPVPGEPPLIGAAGTEQILQTLLSVPNTQLQNLFDLLSNNSSIAYSFNQFLEILKKLAAEHNQTAHLIAEYEAQIVLVKEQKKLVDDLIPLVRGKNWAKALETANNYLGHNPLKDPCPNEATEACPEDKQGLKQLYNSWKNTIDIYTVSINSYSNLDDSQAEQYVVRLETESESFKQQLDLLPDLIKQMNQIQKKLTDEDAKDILEINFLNFSSLNPEQKKRAWDLLAKYFPDIFKADAKFYFIPKGTNYRVCVQAEYCYALDPANPPDCPTGQPVSVCSTISYQPSFWGPNTSFAKSCSTFTP